MGLSIARDSFEPREYQQFVDKVRLDLEVLQQLLQRDGFGDGPASIGAEVEFYIVDSRGRVQPINTEIQAGLDDPQLTVELNRFNLEYNLSPQDFRGTPFGNTERELQQAISRINRVAAPMDGKLVSIGILPTLRRKNFNLRMMTDMPRYHALANYLRELRGGPFDINIRGRDRLDLQADDVTLEGANTSHQLHWRVPTRRFAEFYNAVQLVTPVVLALAANSPTLFQKRLWDETRVALFKQSIDSRAPHQKAWRHPPRVYFGNGWLHHAWEAFAAALALYPPIIPQLGEEDPQQVLAEGGTPELAEMKLHHGTTWPWNRAVYDHHDGGHLRIEMRALPAGPTPVDMSANGLFMIGASLALVNHMQHIASVMPFAYAEHNFYRAARLGLDADLIWPGPSHFELLDLPVTEIAQRLLPMAEDALSRTGLDASELQRLFSVLRGRLETGMSGARWQRRTVARLRRQYDKRESYRRMLEIYMTNSDGGKPLHEWSLDVD